MSDPMADRPATAEEIAEALDIWATIELSDEDRADLWRR